MAAVVSASRCDAPDMLARGALTVARWRSLPTVRRLWTAGAKMPGALASAVAAPAPFLARKVVFSSVCATALGFGASKYATVSRCDSVHGSWAAGTDPASGKTYYYNSSTGETAWEKPSLAAAADENTWMAHTDATTGKTFYRNSRTGETSWEKPSTPPTSSSPLSTNTADQEEAVVAATGPDALKHLTLVQHLLYATICSSLAVSGCCIPTCCLYCSGYQLFAGWCWGHYLFNAVYVEETKDLRHNPQGVKPVGTFRYLCSYAINKLTCGAGDWIYWMVMGGGQTLSESVMRMHLVRADSVDQTMRQYGYMGNSF